MDEEVVKDVEVMMDVDVYLERIGYSGSREPTVETLFQLVARHQLAVPFENIDILDGTQKVLELSTLFSKIVIEYRGGVCYEVHGLFCWMLRKLGFTVKMVASEFLKPKTQEWNLPWTHSLLLVYVGDACYFTDLAWGGPPEPFQPIELKDGIISQQINGTFSLEKDGDIWILKTKDRSLKGHHRGKNTDIVGESWTVALRFYTEERQLGDFQETFDRIQFDKGADILASIPIVLIKKENGQSAGMIVGRRYTHMKFQDGVDVRTNKLNLDDLELKDLLNEKFGINSKKTIVIHEAIGPCQTEWE